MKRVWGHILAGGMLLACAAGVSTACVQDNSTIFIFDVLAQQLVSPGTACTYTSDPTQAYTPAGKLDLGFIDAYSAIFLVGNQIVPQGNATTPTTETSYVQIQGAVVHITDVEGNTLADYTQPVGGAAIAPAQGSVPSYEAISVEILNPSTTEPLRSFVEAGGTRQLITYTYFYGKTLGGQSVQTGQFGFPVTVCYGCLVSYSKSDVDESASIVPNCLLAVGSATSTSLPVPCTLGEDDSVDCSQCLGYPVCRGSISGIVSNLDAGSD